MSECLEKKTNESKKGSITQTILDKIFHAVQTAMPENPRAEAHFPDTVQDNDVFRQISIRRKRKSPSGLSKISSGIQDFVENNLLRFSNRKRSRRSFLNRSNAIEVHSPACILRKFSYILLKERAALAADRIRVKYGVLCQPSHVKIGNGITVYGDKEILGKLIKVTHAYSTLWEDKGNLVDIPEHQWMDILLIEGWENIYKAGQVRAYPVGHQDQEFIKKEFDKLHQQ